MWDTVHHDENMSEPFKILNGIKQDCVLVPTLFELIFLLLLKHAFGTVEEGIRT